MQDEYAANLSKLSLGSEKPRTKQKSERQDTDAAMPDLSQKEGSEGIRHSKESTTVVEEDVPVVERTKPSAFAGTFLNSEAGPVDTIDVAILRQPLLGFDFNSLSPDDVVYRAQTGRTR